MLYTTNRLPVLIVGIHEYARLFEGFDPRLSIEPIYVRLFAGFKKKKKKLHFFIGSIMPVWENTKIQRIITTVAII